MNDQQPPTGNTQPLPTNSVDDHRRQWVEEMIGNALLARREFFTRMMDPRRDIDDECGYPRITEPVSVELYRQLYDREPIANRVVAVMPKEAWQVTPLVYETEEADVATPFEEAWDDLASNLSSGVTYYLDEQGSPIWEHLKRVDILSGIGHFGVLLLGLDDGLNLEQPVPGVLGLPDDNTQPGSQGNGNPNGTSQDRGPPSSPQSTSSPGTAGSPITSRDSKYSSPTGDKGNGNGMGGVTISAPATTWGSLPSAGFQGSDYSAGPSFGVPPGGVMSGTDQQYFGVQFGPPEIPNDKPQGGNGAGGSKPKRKLLFLRAFDESLVQIVRWEWNVRSPRFGMPVMYRITLNDPREQHSGIGLPLATIYVHWSRVIHVNDVGMNAGSSEVMSPPRMRPVLNRLLDLRKLYSGSAEMYWRGAFPGLQLSTHPELGGDVVIDEAKIKDMMEAYANGLQRYLYLMGMSAQTLAPTVVDPTPQINTQIQAVCIQIGCPQRVFMGSERGELASTSDDENWNDRKRERQNGYITPRIIVPFIDRLIQVGVLPVPNYKTPVEEQEEGDQTGGLGGKDGSDTSQSPSEDADAATPGAVPGTTSVAGGSAVPRGNNGNPQFGSKNTAEASKAPPSTTHNRLIPLYLRDQWGRIILNADGQPTQTGAKSSMGYSIEWPDPEALSPTDKATVAMTKTQALGAYVSGGVEAIMPPQEYLTKVLDYEEDEAKTMLDSAKKAQQDQMEQHQSLADEHGFEPTPPPGFQKPAPDIPPELAGIAGKGASTDGGKPNPFAKGGTPKPGQPSPTGNVEFDPDKHPHDEHGRFTVTDAGVGSKDSDYVHPEVQKARDKEDEAISARRNKEDNTIESQQEKEDTALEKVRDKEDKGIEKTRTAEDKADVKEAKEISKLEKAADEDKRDRAYRAIEKGRNAEDKAREKEVDAIEDTHNDNIERIESDYDTGKISDSERTQHHAEEDSRHEREVAEVTARHEAQDKVREQEDAERESRQAQEDAEIETRQLALDAKIEKQEVARETEDEERYGNRNAFDIAKEERRNAERDAREDSRAREDEELEQRRWQEDNPHTHNAYLTANCRVGDLWQALDNMKQTLEIINAYKE